MSSAIFGGGGGGWLPSTSRSKAALLTFTVKTESKQPTSSDQLFHTFQLVTQNTVDTAFISCVQQVYSIFVLTRHSVLSSY